MTPKIRALVVLFESDIKEELSYAYLHAIASRAGFSVDRVGKDRDSIDVTIRARGKLSDESILMSTTLDVQLKCTSRDVADEDAFPFELSRKNYDDLRGERSAPRILVVLFLPEDASQWLSHSLAGLVSRRCAHWCNLHGLADTTNSDSKTVYVPKANVFDCAGLRSIMERASRREQP